MDTRLTYAGVGARNTPEPMLRTMTKIGEQMARSGWLLRSGFADGADKAFGLGAEPYENSWQMLLPWDGFNGAPKNDHRFASIKIWDHMAEIAEEYHPGWKYLTNATQLLMVRNVAVVLGMSGDDHADLLVCWTHNGQDVGGTGHAIKVAAAYGVPVFNLYHEHDQRKLVECVEQMERAAQPIFDPDELRPDPRSVKPDQHERI